ncbi:MAG: hypothetical protein BGP06_21085 [Rhizobiales bacterium 65-9]|nr:DUF1761 domain-containing protein [Hyphomicrobiales bacterium]OJY36610.1 MAG: hypothetical protein BGP06_21085 [Rhizobiales bacterium 65-9]
MTYLGVNYLAIAIATFAGYLFGAAWHMMLARPWLAASEFSAEQRARIEGGGLRAPAPFLISLLAQALMAYILASLLAHLGAPALTVRGGAFSGFLIWLGFVATTLVTNHAFGMRRWALTLIDGGHWLGVLLIQGAVLGAIGAPGAR